MKPIHWSILILFGISGFAWASPMSIAVDSEEKIKKIGAKIEHEPVEKKGDDDYLTFRVSWKPKFKTQEDLGYRLDLIVWKDNNHNRPVPTKFQVRYHPGDDGICRADFSLARSEISLASLAFRGSRNHEYWISLEDFMNGFPNKEDTIFFIDPITAEGAAPNP